MNDHRPLQLPCLVYCKEEGDGQVLYDEVHQRWGEKNIPWFDDNVCMDANSGWLLLRSLDTHQLSMFHHCTGQQLSLPMLPESEIEPDDQFICRFSSSPPDCHVIAIPRMGKFIYHCRRGQTEWTKHEFYLPEPPDPNAYQVLLDVAVYDGKIYAMVARYLLVIDFSSNNDTPDVSYIGTWGPWGFDLSSPCPAQALPMRLTSQNYRIKYFIIQGMVGCLRQVPLHGSSSILSPKTKSIFLQKYRP